MIRSTALVAVSGLVLASCAPTYNGTSSGGNENTTTGAVTGAVIGGLIAGPITGGGGGKAAAGAVAGAALGGLIGQQLDKQARELDRDLGDGITVNNQGDQLLVSFPQDILFAVDSAAVSSGAQSELRTFAANLQRYPDTNVIITGHTDNTGEAAYNFDLSTRRAGSVASVLVGAGVSGGRITATGRGEDAPIASNLNAEGRAQNRRVEVIIRPATQG